MQRSRVESEVVALSSARLPDGRIRRATPPPLPPDALGEAARAETKDPRGEAPREPVRERSAPPPQNDLDLDLD
jgi:hypothetical protein